ncbi:tetratricopeptide repeat protein [Methylocella sp.]|uniref:O-linked N-acetylglucosamine transferase family protein n=1 Tax=Methylocella sp. TaxID=1978226 RepID=UPI0037835564
MDGWDAGAAAQEAEGADGAGTEDAALTLAQELLRAGRHEDAQDTYMRLLARVPGHPQALHHLGLIAHRRGAHEDAAGFIARAIAGRPAYVEALSNLAAVFRALKRPDDALKAAGRALAIDPGFAQAHSNQGAALEDMGRLEDALAAYRCAGALNPGFVEAFANAANALRKLGRFEEALAVCAQAARARPDAAEPHYAQGRALKDLGRLDDAIEAFRRALALRPDFVEARVALGNALQARGACEEAAAAYRAALVVAPGLADAHANLGAALEQLGRLDEAMACYARAVDLDPSLLHVKIWLHHKRRILCDWSGIEAEEAELLRLIDAPGVEADPFALLSMATSPAQQLRAAKAASKAIKSRKIDFGPRPAPHPAGKLRVGFLSNDFGRHATALLAAQLFELIDRSRFELFAYSHGRDDRSAMGARLRAAFDAFVDICDLSDEDAARRVHADGIEILIDLKGHTNGARLAIMATRPAPAQASFLGFPGTTGADFIDYAVADAVVAPLAQADDFSEKLVHLPHCYQPNDATRPIAEAAPTRAECGLPERGFVFCCFNNSYKLTPAFFDIWMRLLNARPDSVLWLVESNARARDNLRGQAQRRGVAPERLVFAQKLASPEHLARHRLADLFLDTLPYGAHTTASDALWAGLPVLTCLGETFAGRAAASLVYAVGLPEMVASSPADYERRALELSAGEGGELRAIREKLAAARLRAPLFDAPRYARAFEGALLAMWEVHAAGEPPRALAVADASDPAPAPARLKRVPYDACPLCGCSDAPQVLGADCTRHALYQPALPPTMEWRECVGCGHVFTDGWFDAAACEVIFSKTHPGQTVGYDMERQRLVSARMVERVARRVASGRWLDVGFGSGSLLFTAQEWGFVPVGIDLRAKNVETLASLGIESRRAPIEELEGEATFDVVSMADVLEHMPFPRKGLDAARKLLRPGGALFASMPNMDSMLWRLLHANGVNPYWGEIEHYHNFSRERLYALLREHGFTPVDYAVSERYRACMEVIALRG